MENRLIDNVRKSIVTELGLTLVSYKIPFCLAGRTAQNLVQAGDIYASEQVDDIDFRVMYEDYYRVIKLGSELNKMGYTFHNWASHYKLSIQKSLYIEIHFLHKDGGVMFFRKGDEDNRESIYWPNVEFPPKKRFIINHVVIPVEPRIEGY
ncbi:MAG TPA: hypothetical protein VFW52_02600 [Candidatus Saccharimonadales bacterium]|nr:hypothetical protein [Candidatus Saccharimonadales bacterium]